MVKIREMSKQELKEYYKEARKRLLIKNPNYFKDKTKNWRKKNPIKNKESRLKYRKSQKGKIANKRYASKRKDYYRNYFRNHPYIKKMKKEYIKDYMHNYLKDREKHRKYLVRQKDNKLLRRELLNEIGCCMLCGSQLNLELHHNKYESGKENVMLLCRKCHRRLHWKI